MLWYTQKNWLHDKIFDMSIFFSFLGEFEDGNTAASSLKMPALTAINRAKKYRTNNVRH